MIDVRRSAAVGVPNDTILKKYASIWEFEKAIGTTGLSMEDAGQAKQLLKFANIARPNSSSVPIIDFVREVTSTSACAGASPAFVAVAEELAGVLPSAVTSMVDSVTKYRQVKQTIDHLNQGRPVGLLQCAECLHMANELVDPVAAQNDIQVWKSDLTKAAVSMFSELQGKLAMDAIDRFIAKYNEDIDIMACAHTWDFKKCEWLLGKERDAARDSEFKAIDKFATGFSPSIRQLKDLHGMIDKIYWLGDEKKTEIKELFKKADVMQSKKASACRTLAVLMLVNAQHTGQAVAETKKYVADKLNVPMHELPDTLLVKLGNGQPHTSGPTSAPAVPKDEDDGQTAASGPSGMRKLRRVAPAQGFND